MKLSILSFIQLTLITLLPCFTNVAGLGLYDNATCGCHPDPHFNTFDSTWYDFQGACDVVLIKKIDPVGNSIELHIATEPRGVYSAIVRVGLRINNEVLDLVDSDNFTAEVPTSLGGFSATASVSSFEQVAEVDLGGGYFIRITNWVTTWSPGLSIQVFGNGDLFQNSEGMCGSWNSGGVARRDGSPFSSTNTTTWAEEWQVQDSEKIFDTVNDACLGPGTCVQDFPFGTTDEGCNPDVPKEIRHQADHATAPRDGTGSRNLSNLKCTRTCNDIPAEYPELRANCYYDVIATGISEYACQPTYVRPVIIKQPPPCDDHECVSVKPNLCEKNGGRCVKGCVTSSKFTCNPLLCTEVRGAEMPPRDLAKNAKLKGTNKKAARAAAQETKKDDCDCAIPVRQVPVLQAQLVDV